MNIFNRNRKSKRIEPFNDIFSKVRIDKPHKKKSSKKMTDETRNVKNILRAKIRILLERIHNEDEGTINNKMKEVDTEINRLEKEGKHSEIIEMLNTLINGVSSIVEQIKKYKGKKVAWGDSPKNKTKLKSKTKTKRTKTKKNKKPKVTPHPPSYSPPKSNEGRAKSKRAKSKRAKSKCTKRSVKKNMICFSSKNKRFTRKLKKLGRQLSKMKGIRLSKCSKKRLKRNK
tara:strand:- start:771 stop:1457 length:687 start_codon:yes stop_codon:yes gene_type:complete